MLKSVFGAVGHSLCFHSGPVNYGLRPFSPHILRQCFPFCRPATACISQSCTAADNSHLSKHHGFLKSIGAMSIGRNYSDGGWNGGIDMTRRDSGIAEGIPDFVHFLATANQVAEVLLQKLQFFNPALHIRLSSKPLNLLS